MDNIKLTKHIFGDLNITQDNFIGTFGPRQFNQSGLTNTDIKNKVKHPYGTPPLSTIAMGCKHVLIVTDDNTRLTPLHRILPPVLAELKKAGINEKNITILIGLGTHRAMTEEEIIRKFGEEICSKYQIINHDWNNPDILVSYGDCELGFEVVINKLAKESDFIISIGSIVPHATAGFSGGGKTIMPGISGEKTIEDTHWAALEYDMADILGNVENKVRQAIIRVSKNIGLNFIINTVLFNDDNIYDLVAGDVDIAHRKGIEISKSVYGVEIPQKAEIVIAESYPTDIDLRQAIKAICSADLICKDNGVIILPAECPEGAAPQFPNFSRYGFKNPDDLFSDVETGQFKEKLMAYTLVAIGRIISKRIKAILVSPNIFQKEAEQLGFYWAPDLQDSIDLAYKLTHSEAKIVLLKQAGEILPILKP